MREILVSDEEESNDEGARAIRLGHVPRGGVRDDQPEGNDEPREEAQVDNRVIVHDALSAATRGEAPPSPCLPAQPCECAPGRCRRALHLP